MTTPDTAPRIEQFSAAAHAIEREIARVIVGQQDVIRDVLICVLAGRHALLEGVPGLGKTMLIRTMGDALDLRFSRIQFTPDMQPTDITGTEILEENEDGRRVRRFQSGPIFANLVLADEINRATPKTQSALLEAMAEKTVTVAQRTYTMELPFFVLATQNPLEMEGTYPLPEAQLDRFMFKIAVNSPSVEELTQILNRTTGGETPRAEKVADGAQVIELGRIAAHLPADTAVVEAVARIITATHPDSKEATPLVKRYVRYGASPRGAQAIVMGAKIHALLSGGTSYGRENIRAVAKQALRHRLLLNFDGIADQVNTDTIIADVLAAIIPEGR